MPKYILIYHQPQGYAPGADRDAMAAWVGFFEAIADNVTDPGQPVYAGPRTLGEVGASTQLGGYSLVNATSLEEAAALANACPSLTHGGGVQIGELAELPPDHPASLLRQRMSRA